MLDGLIAMLELIVAMEQLGDIDVDGNGIDFSDLFILNADGQVEEYTEGYRNLANYIIDSIDETSENYNADLAAIVNDTKINGISLAEIFRMTP